MPTTEPEQALQAGAEAPVVHVAVGLVIRGAKVLVAQRAAHLHQGGLWEFPGGKVEAGERVDQALCRELAEEVAITVTALQPELEVRHDYSDKRVLLDVWRVTAFEGEAVGAEGQPVRWVDDSTLASLPVPAANQRIVDRALQLLGAAA